MVQMAPDRAQTSSAATGDPACCSTPPGETNTPEPMILPTIIEMPFVSVIRRFNVTSSEAAIAIKEKAAGKRDTN